MKRLPLIGSVTLLSGLLLSLTVVNNPAAQENPTRASRESSSSAAQTPIRYTLSLLQVAAKPLMYFPAMERAVASSYPETFKTDEVFAESEITLVGLGPLRIGMTLEEATNALGLPLIPLGRNLSGECAHYQADTKSQTLGVMVVDDRVIRVDVWPGSTLSTVSGAKIGSSEADIMALYPGQIESTPNPYTKGKFLTLVPNNPELSIYRLVFETDAEGKVIQYRTGQFPAVTWPDGCV